MSLSALPTWTAAGNQGEVRIFQPEEVSSALLQVMRDEQQCQTEVFIRCAKSPFSSLRDVAMPCGSSFQSASAQQGTGQHSTGSLICSLEPMASLCTFLPGA